MPKAFHRPAGATARCAPAPFARMPLPIAALAGALVAGLLVAEARAGEADVVGGTIDSLGGGRYLVEATVRHDDIGWDHYANRWDVLAPDGTLLGSRELFHPHENEQPFTRSLTLEIPPGIERVTLRAFDSVHGDGGESVELEVPGG